MCMETNLNNDCRKTRRKPLSKLVESTIYTWNLLFSARDCNRVWDTLFQVKWLIGQRVTIRWIKIPIPFPVRKFKGRNIPLDRIHKFQVKTLTLVRCFSSFDRIPKRVSRNKVPREHVGYLKNCKIHPRFLLNSLLAGRARVGSVIIRMTIGIK